MKRRISIIISLIIVLLAANMFVVSAECDIVGTPTNDTITCTGFSSTVQGIGGEDTITVTGTLSGFVVGGPDADQIIIDGMVDGNVYGDVDGDNQTSDDVIIINGTVNGVVIGDSRQSNVAAGNDTIIISGTVTGNVIGDSSTQTIAVPGGNDTIILQDGANGGSDNRLIIIGLIGYDTLVFQFTVNSKAEYQALSDLIAAANPNDGSIVINGQTYRWIQMEELKML